MFPDPDFPKPTGSFPGPAVIPETDPSDGDQICVQFGSAWLPYVLGCLTQLELTSTWQYSTDAELATAKAYADNLINLFLNGVTCMSGFMLAACDDPDCGLKYSTDGGLTWTCIDLTTCISTIWDSKMAGAFDDGLLGKGVNQQGPQQRPGALVCRTYHVKLKATESWRCPSPLTTGDTIQVENWKGGWNDGAVYWYCPDGNSYGLGSCTPGSSHTESGDPLNTRPHMSVIGKVGTSYFDPQSGVYTIPSPTPLSPVYLQPNDSALADNIGEIEFDVTVCSSTAVSWCHEWDFTTGKQGWDFYPNPFTGVAYGTYVAGHGFRTDGSEVAWFRTNDVNSAITIDYIEAEMESDSADRCYFRFWFYPAASHEVSATPGTDPQTIADSWVTTSADGIYWWVQLSVTTGYNTMRKLRVFGSQTANPFGADNCTPR